MSRSLPNFIYAFKSVKIHYVTLIYNLHTWKTDDLESDGILRKKKLKVITLKRLGKIAYVSLDVLQGQ